MWKCCFLFLGCVLCIHFRRLILTINTVMSMCECVCMRWDVWLCCAFLSCSSHKQRLNVSRNYAVQITKRTWLPDTFDLHSGSVCARLLIDVIGMKGRRLVSQCMWLNVCMCVRLCVWV